MSHKCRKQHAWARKSSHSSKGRKKNLICAGRKRARQVSAEIRSSQLASMSIFHFQPKTAKIVQENLPHFSYHSKSGKEEENTETISYKPTKAHYRSEMPENNPSWYKQKSLLGQLDGFYSMWKSGFVICGKQIPGVLLEAFGFLCQRWLGSA